MRREPEVVRWWQEPRDDFLEEEAGVHKYAVLLDADVIGFVQWHEETDPMYRHAGVDLLLDPAFHGRGLGTETVRVVCAHLIDEQGFHRIVIDPEVANEVAIACYRKVGFKPVGVMRRYQRDRSGEWQDGLLMDLLADELVRG
jgi:aminoglycoside 6'-N-acetyltransferase